MTRLSVISAATLLIAGCSPHESARSVSWYVEHPEVLPGKTAWCLDDATREQTDDCQNATQAKRRLAMGSHTTLKPIDWGAAKPAP